MHTWLTTCGVMLKKPQNPLVKLAIYVHKKEYEGLCVPNLQNLNFALLDLGLNGTLLGRDLNGNQLLRINTIPETLTSRVFIMYTPPNFGKVRHNWHLMQLTWGSNDMQEDIWFGYSTLATQCWYIYFVGNEQSKTLVELWDGSELNCAFRRTFTGSCSQLIRIVKSKRCSTLRCLPRFRCLCLF